MRLVLGVFLLSLGFTSCRTPDPTNLFAEKNEGRPDFPAAIPDSALPKAKEMTKGYFRASYPNLSDKEFAEKWKSSLKSPLLFFRSYVNTWYQEVNNIPGQGKVGPCFGDPHPENFGFIWYGDDDFRYLFNDMDDAGVCPVGFDALRYFTALKLYWHDSEAEKKVRDEYVAALEGKTQKNPSAIKDFRPKLQDLYAKIDKKYLDDDRIRLSEGSLESVDIATRDALFQAVQNGLKPSDSDSFEYLDAASIVVKSSGSAFLDRYYVLLKDSSGERQLLELKEITTPATDLGDWQADILDRRSLLMYLAWENEIPKYFAFTQKNGKEFIIRSKVKTSIDLDETNKDEKIALFKYQVNLLAAIHQFTIKDAENFGKWLDKESEFMARRYREAYKLAQANRG